MGIPKSGLHSPPSPPPSSSSSHSPHSSISMTGELLLADVGLSSLIIKKFNEGKGLDSKEIGKNSIEKGTVSDSKIKKKKKKSLGQEELMEVDGGRGVEVGRGRKLLWKSGFGDKFLIGIKRHGRRETTSS